MKVVLGSWDALGARAMALRETVFVQEQGVPMELERCAQDPHCVHALALDVAGEVLGTGRLLPDGHIGRMAVRADARRRGVGSALLRALVDEARRKGHGQVRLSSQLHAQPFYAAHGFVAFGEVYLDAGIGHRDMVRDL